MYFMNLAMIYIYNLTTNILTDIIRDSIKPYCDTDAGKFATIVAFDCRGIEPVDFSPRVSLDV